MEAALQNSRELMQLYQEKVLPELDVSVKSNQLHWKRRIREIDETILALAEQAARSDKPKLFDSQFMELIAERKGLDALFENTSGGVEDQSELAVVFDLAV